MRTLHLDDTTALSEATNALQGGQLIIVPTDTVYGLAAQPEHPAAVEAIYRAKDRPTSVHLPIMAASLNQVAELGVELGPAALRLADRWWPGPLTMALSFHSGAARPLWLEGRDEVAVRIPGHDFLLDLLERTGPLLVTSANQHGSVTPPSAFDAADSLASAVTLLIDGGTLTSFPSTLVNLRTTPPAVEREGAIGANEISALANGAP
jgi:L-threonylcarbamoyladenylate synthase